MAIDGEVDSERIDFLGQRITVLQKTPQRVAHRRAAKDRERWVEFLEITPAEEHEGHFRVRMQTQHGTYVKEVLSGEHGQTEPSLTTLLGVTCRCEQLDVLGILDEDGEKQEYTAPPVFGAGL